MCHHVPNNDVLNEPAARFTVLFVDDNVPLIDALEDRLKLESGFSAMYRAVPLTDAAATAARAKPDIVLLDVNLSEGLDALLILETIVRDTPRSRVIMFTGRPTALLVTRSMSLGAWGFVSKGVSVERLISAIHRVRHGEAVIELDAET